MPNLPFHIATAHKIADVLIKDETIEGKYIMDLLKKDKLDLYKLVKKCVSTEYTKRPLIKTVLSNLN